jgi:hypothetical protein
LAEDIILAKNILEQILNLEKNMIPEVLIQLMVLKVEIHNLQLITKEISMEKRVTQGIITS